VFGECHDTWKLKMYRPVVMCLWGCKLRDTESLTDFLGCYNNPLTTDRVAS